MTALHPDEDELAAVRRAIRIVEPPTDRRDAFGRDVIQAMYAIEEANERRVAILTSKDKDAKRAALRLGRAVRGVVAVWTDKNEKKQPPLELFLNPFTLSKLIGLAERCDEIVKSPSGVLPRMAAEAKRDAASKAYRLMKKYGVHPTATKGSKFCKVAAVLLGDPKADMVSQCKAHIRAVRKGEKPGTK